MNQRSMNRCPISYQTLAVNEQRYSRAGLRSLSRSLRSLEDIEYSAEEQRREAAARASKMSVQGVQPKLSSRLSVRKSRFEIVDQGGTFILKPQVQLWENVPENEDLTMRLAATIKIPVPLHGLIYSLDGSLTYFIRRFDRIRSHGKPRKRAVEDFAQLAGATRDTKYNSSMEHVASLLDYCTFPAIERVELLKRTLFSFLVGNEDMHLKNFSLISEPLTKGVPTGAPFASVRVRLSPAYDLLNTTLVVPGTKEELALPLRGKKRKLDKDDFLVYYARERLSLTPASIEDVLETFHKAIETWPAQVEESFLPNGQKEEYLGMVVERSERLGLGS